MSRPADHGRRFSKSRGSSQVGSEGGGDLTGRVGSSRVGSGGLLKSRVGPGRPDPFRPARNDPTREKPWSVWARLARKSLSLYRVPKRRPFRKKVGGATFNEE